MSSLAWEEKSRRSDTRRCGVGVSGGDGDGVAEEGIRDGVQGEGGAKAHTFSCWVGLFFGAISLLLHKLIPAPFLSVPTGSSWVSPSLLSFPGLRPELYEAETRPTYGSEAEPHPCNNGAA